MGNVREPGGLSDRVERLARAVERAGLQEYAGLFHNPWRLIWVNFLAGVARGVGWIFGAAVVSTLLLAILRPLVRANLPLMGKFIADMVRVVEVHLR